MMMRKKMTINRMVSAALAMFEGRLIVGDELKEILSYVGKDVPVILSSGLCGKWHFLNKRTGKRVVWWCGQGRCRHEECQRLFYRRRVASVTGIVRKYGLRRFFTLTLNRSLTRKDAWTSVHGIWVKMRHRLRREAKEQNIGFRFVAILERHLDGYPHIHGFTNLYLGKKEWRKHWVESGGGRGTWVEEVTDIAKAGDYVGKEIDVKRYVCKTAIGGAAREVARGFRTIWRSTDTLTEEEEEKKDLRQRKKAGIIESEWALIKEQIPTKGEGNAEEEWKGRDLEGLCKEELQPEGSLEQVEAEEATGRERQEDFFSPGTTWQDQFGDQETKRPIRRY